MLRAIDGYEGSGVTRYAMQLAPHGFVRPGELSGQTPTPADPAAPEGSRADWGDTQAQACAAFAKLAATLAGLDLAMGDMGFGGAR